MKIKQQKSTFYCNLFYTLSTYKQRIQNELVILNYFETKFSFSHLSRYVRVIILGKKYLIFLNYQIVIKTCLWQNGK